MPSIVSPEGGKWQCRHEPQEGAGALMITHAQEVVPLITGCRSVDHKPQNAVVLAFMYTQMGGNAA